MQSHLQVHSLVHIYVRVWQCSLLGGEFRGQLVGEGEVTSLPWSTWAAKQLDRRADITGGGGRMIHRLGSGRGREGVASTRLTGTHTHHLPDPKSNFTYFTLSHW